MPTDFDGVPEFKGCKFPLWHGITSKWLRNSGRTRVLVIDDQIRCEDGFLSKDDSRQMMEWMNVRFEFFHPPNDFKEEKTGETRGSFNDQWFEDRLRNALKDSTPVTAVLMDLMFGQERSLSSASGPRFAAILRRHLKDTPLFVLSNEQESDAAWRSVKLGGNINEISVSAYLPKSITGGAGLSYRLQETLLQWGYLSDPMLCAISPKMRRLAQSMRQIVMRNEITKYEEGNAEYPKPVVISGEVGSGKNYVALNLHKMSKRRELPLERIAFSGVDKDHFVQEFMGIGLHSTTSTRYVIDKRDGSVLRRVAGASRQNLKAHEIELSQMGKLHKAFVDSKGKPPWPATGGTLIVDEIGAGTDQMRDCLLDIFNRGRFVPDMSETIPTGNTLDVWFLVTLSPEGESKLKPDLRRRLYAGTWLNIPGLADRIDDLIPLAMRAVGIDNFEPDEVFSSDAQTRFLDFAREKQAGQIIRLLQGLSEVTEHWPYTSADMDAVIARRSNLVVSMHGIHEPTEMAEPASNAIAAIESLDDFSVLQKWRQGGKTNFASPTKQMLKDRRGTVVAGAAVAVLSYLELCLNETAEDSDYSAIRAWNVFSDKKVSTTDDARTRCAGLFLIDEQVSLEKLRKSDVLLWLAGDIVNGKRSVKLYSMLEILKNEPDQAERLKVIIREPSKAGRTKSRAQDKKTRA